MFRKFSLGLRKITNLNSNKLIRKGKKKINLGLSLKTLHISIKIRRIRKGILFSEDIQTQSKKRWNKDIWKCNMNKLKNKNKIDRQLVLLMIGLLPKARSKNKDRKSYKIECLIQNILSASNNLKQRKC